MFVASSADAAPDQERDTQHPRRRRGLRGVHQKTRLPEERNGVRGAEDISGRRAHRDLRTGRRKGIAAVGDAAPAAQTGRRPHIQRGEPAGEALEEVHVRLQVRRSGQGEDSEGDLLLRQGQEFADGEPHRFRNAFPRRYVRKGNS